MPIDVEISVNQKMVYASCRGIISNEDLISYQKHVWKNDDVLGFDCLFDMTSADFTQLNFSDLLPFAYNANQIDLDQPRTKLAIVASSELQEKLGGFYKAAIDLLPGKTRSTQIFKSRDQAYDWILNKVFQPDY